MQIDIDFEVYKALTALRQSEADTYNDVVRRALGLPKDVAVDVAKGLAGSSKRGMFGAGAPAGARAKGAGLGSSWLSRLTSGAAIFNGVILPEGTLLKATYKGVPYTAEIKAGRWVDQDGVVRSSPSDAAGAISGTNVNGWRFWFAKRPDDNDWARLDELK